MTIEEITVDVTVKKINGADVSFDARLTLASAGMDAILAHRHSDALEGAQAAVQEALEAPELLAPEPIKFKSNAILLQAGFIIEYYGWYRGNYESDDMSAVCTREAIFRAGITSRPSDIREAETELLNRIAVDTGKTMSIADWNDSRASLDEVLRLLY